MRISGGQWRGRALLMPKSDQVRPTQDRVREALFNLLQPVLPGARFLDLFAGSGAVGLEALSRGAREVTFLERDRAVFATLLRNLEAFGVDACYARLLDVCVVLGGMEGLTAKAQMLGAGRYAAPTPARLEGWRDGGAERGVEAWKRGSVGEGIADGDAEVQGAVPPAGVRGRAPSAHASTPPRLHASNIVFADPPYRWAQEYGFAGLAQAIVNCGWLAEEGFFVAECDYRTDPEEIPDFTLLRDRTYGKTRLLVWQRRRTQ